MKLTVKSDRPLIRAGARSTRYVLVRVLAPRAVDEGDRPPASVAIVLDRSGSMAGDRKFPLASQAAERALGLLQSHDRFSLIVYDEIVDVLAPSTPATPEAKRRALDALATVGPRGSTNLADGWLRGCEQAGQSPAPNASARCLLLTDGLANVGITDRDELSLHAGELRTRSVSTSTLGVGADFDERLLRDMALEGGGHFYFVDTAEQIGDILTSELGEALEVTVRRARLDVTLPANIECEVLNRFRASQRSGSDVVSVELGDLVSEQELSLVLKLNFPRGTIDDSVTLAIGAAGDGIEAINRATMSFRYATHEANDFQKRDVEVDREVARLYAARARAEATEANRIGDLDHARVSLQRVASRIKSYAGNDPTLRGIVAELEASVPEMAQARMSPAALKGAFFAAEMAVQSRAPRGQARRGNG